MFDLKDRIALIAGLGQQSSDGWGIGSAIAVLLARRGAIIFGGNRTLDSGMITKRRIEEEGGRCDVVTTDVTSSVSVQSLVEACLAAHGRIDILVNNVGGSQPGCPATLSEEVWDSQIDLNLKSVYLTCHYVLPVMESQSTGGCIVNVSSIAGMRYIGKPQVAYSATKAAVLNFTATTVVIYAARGVRLNAVVPGLMETPYTEAMAAKYAPNSSVAEFKETRNKQVPMGMMGDAWDVANAVLFLVSDEARYITGQSLVVDGGITCSTGPARV